MERIKDPWFKGYMVPDYGEPDSYGTTIANIPATIGKLFGVEIGGLPSLPEACWQPLLSRGPVERIVVFIIDAMGYHFQADGERSAIAEDLAQKALVHEKITSVFPSTTVNALSTIWTGYAPGHHGLVALNLLDPLLNAVNMMLQWRPASLPGTNDAMLKAGVSPEAFLPVPGLAEQLATYNIPTIDIKGRDIINSTLSRMHGRGVAQRKGVMSYVELMWQIVKTLEQESGPLLIMSYWPTIDTLSHMYGPRHAVVQKELDSILYQVQTALIDKISASAAKGTAFLLFSDHGQCTINPDQSINLGQMPQIESHLTLTAAGEARVPYLYTKHGSFDTLKELLTAVSGEPRF
ncbi:MAG: alkaline phosphatase family protein, partial [Chloroflexota bacterium]